MLELLLDAEVEVSKEQCKGVVFKADVQHCRTQRGVLFSIRLNKMKRMSCTGCAYCWWLDEDLSNIDSEYWPIIDIEKAEHGKLYTIEMCNVGRDWESGHVDSWDLKLVPYEEL